VGRFIYGLSMRKALALLLALNVAVAQGCGTIFFHNPQSIRLTTNVPGAIVIAKNEGVLGRMPSLQGNFELDRSKTHVLVISAHDNETQSVVVYSHFSWWRMLISLGGDIGLGFFTFFIFPVLAIPVDSLDGSWRVLDDDLCVNLRPREGPRGLGVTSDGPPSVAEPAAGVKACPICGEPMPTDGKSCPSCGLK